MMHPLPFAAENTLAHSAPVVVFGDHEFPPLVPDDGWQLVADEKDAFVVRQEEDWGCIVEGFPPLYARVAQQATALPPPPAPSKHKHPAPAARTTTPSTATGVLEYETADDLFVQCKSSSNHHRRRRRSVHGYCKKPSIHPQQQPEATSIKRPKQRAGAKKQTARA